MIEHPYMDTADRGICDVCDRPPHRLHGPHGGAGRAVQDDGLDVERLANEEAHHVIERWMREKMLRFSTYDDGSDDLILAAEIARRIDARLSRPSDERSPLNASGDAPALQATGEPPHPLEAERLRRISELQPEAVATLRKHGFVMDRVGPLTDDADELTRWKVLAFSLYTDIVEASTIADHILEVRAGATGEGEPAP